MPKPRSGRATWNGDLPSGDGRLTVGDGVFEGAYTFESRFEEGEGTNPEELIAAAHAACFAMAFAGILAGEGHTPESIDASARVVLKEIDGAPTLARIELTAEGTVPGIDEAEYGRLAEQAKKECPVSRALASVPEIELEASLRS
jgi:osmotically inducible protein OsmC